MAGKARRHMNQLGVNYPGQPELCSPSHTEHKLAQLLAAALQSTGQAPGDRSALQVQSDELGIAGKILAFPGQTNSYAGGLLVKLGYNPNKAFVERNPPVPGEASMLAIVANWSANARKATVAISQHGQKVLKVTPRSNEAKVANNTTTCLFCPRKNVCSQDSQFKRKQATKGKCALSILPLFRHSANQHIPQRRT